VGQPWLSVDAGWQTWACFDDVAAAARGVLRLVNLPISGRPLALPSGSADWAQQRAAVRPGDAMGS